MQSINRSERIGRVLLLGATLALAWIGQGLLRADPPRLLDGGAILGLAALAFAALVSWSRDEGALASGQEPRGLRRLIATAPRSSALFGAGILCGASAFWLESNPAMLPWPALLAWAAGIGLVLAGAWTLPAQPDTAEPPDAAAHALPVTRAELIALLALTIIALLARVLMLDGIPQNFGGDEGEMGMMARSVLSGDLRDPFITGWLSHPTLWFFTQALALRVFGNDVFGLRLLSALIGTATVPTLYLFARPLYGRAIALAAAALLACYHFHIHFSRLGVNNIADPLLALLAFAAFFHGYRTRSPLSFALSGVALGLAQHLYMGSRLTPLVLLAVLAHQLLLDRQRVIALRWHLALLALAFLVAFGPLLRYFLLHPSDFSARMAMVGIFQTGWFSQRLAEGASALQVLAEQARSAFGAFTYQPDRSAWYDPHIPMLDRASSVLFVLGLALTITRWRRPESILLLAWLVGVAVLGGMILVNSPESPRYVTAVPALCLLIALALDQIGRVVRWALPLGQRPAYGLVGAAVLLLALWNLNFYFREYTPRRTYGWLNTEVATEMGLYLRSQPDPVYVYFFGPPRMFIANGSIRFLAPDVPGGNVDQPLVSADQLTPPSDRRPIFIFLPERSAELELVKSRYPNGTLRQFDAVFNDSTLFLSYEPR